MKLFGRLVAGLLMWVCCGNVLAQTPEAAAARFDEFIDEVDRLGPGYAYVIVTPDEVLRLRVIGERQAGSQLPLTSGTPIYIASQTKAYLGLLASHLDRTGVLDLQSRLADFWPDLELDGGIDAAEFTLHDLLTHQFRVRAARVNIIQANAMVVEPDAMPELIEQFGEIRDPGFRYDNIGYNIYAAILEQQTGRNWQDWLAEIVFDPLELNQTSTRTSDATLDDLAWGHSWMGEDEGWFPIRPKTDAMMQSAGGIMTSPRDMARFLQANLQRRPSHAGALTEADFSLAQTRHVDTQSTSLAHGEMPCPGYAYGWFVCDFQGHVIYTHGGAYTGTRSMMAFSRELGVGIAVFALSENETGWFNSNAINTYFQFLVDDPDAPQLRDYRIQHFMGIFAEEFGAAQEAQARTEASSFWGDYAWAPDESELREYAGAWSAGDVYSTIQIDVSGDRLLVSWGDYEVVVRPASVDRFAGQRVPLGAWDVFRFARDEDGILNVVTWDGIEYQRELVR